MTTLIENILNYIFVPIFMFIWAIFSAVTKFTKDVLAYAYKCAVRYFGKLLFKVSLAVAILLIGVNLMQ
jgi:CRISPR/Cas system CMR-associated protein Cmr3 (group 5 of RAMP superfamily)